MSRQIVRRPLVINQKRVPVVAWVRESSLLVANHPSHTVDPALHDRGLIRQPEVPVARACDLLGFGRRDCFAWLEPPVRTRRVNALATLDAGVASEVAALKDIVNPPQADRVLCGTSFGGSAFVGGARI